MERIAELLQVLEERRENAKYLPALDYVDVRGIWPTYHKGLIAVKLEGKKRDITVEDAREVATIFM